MMKSFQYGRWCIDINWTNPKYGYYNVQGKRCIFLGALQIYYYGRYKE